MLKTFPFRKKPEYQYSKSQVAVSIQDFEQLVEYAENWMNLASPSGGSPNAKTVHQQININQLWVDHGQHHPTPSHSSSMSVLVQAGKDAIAQITATSHILTSESGKRLGSTPLEFLSMLLKKFKKANRIFATRDFLPKTTMASNFHAACDNVPDVLVIIKSGQYIAGGYTEVPFESPTPGVNKPNPLGSTFVYSANRRKVYALKDKDEAICCQKDRGPVFGNYCGLWVYDDIASTDSNEALYNSNSNFNEPGVVEGELFGTKKFKVDEYEVYKLE